MAKMPFVHQIFYQTNQPTHITVQQPRGIMSWQERIVKKSEHNDKGIGFQNRGDSFLFPACLVRITGMRYLVLEALATACGSFFTLRFASQLANIELARAGKRRWIRSIR
jgi:hypothetical protein